MAKVCKPDGERTIAGMRGNGEDAPKADPVACVRSSYVNRELSLRALPALNLNTGSHYAHS
jgi:hypothetical protein